MDPSIPLSDEIKQKYAFTLRYEPESEKTVRILSHFGIDEKLYGEFTQWMGNVDETEENVSDLRAVFENCQLLKDDDAFMKLEDGDRFMVWCILRYRILKNITLNKCHCSVCEKKVK